MSTERIDLAEFLSVCVFLAEEGGRVIRQVEQSHDLQTIDKGDAGPVTIADFIIQRTIEDNLRAIYPTLTVMGEESPENIKNVKAACRPE